MSVWRTEGFAQANGGGLAQAVGRSSIRIAQAGILAASLVIAVGTAWALIRGGNDFAVFHHAARLVWEGRGREIYSNSPDRFLYAPGFAWVLSPFGALPRELALSLWCFLKAGVLGAWFVALARRVVRSYSGVENALFVRSWIRSLGFGLACLSLFYLARPVLIDFTYGQVNLLLLVVAWYALAAHLEESPESNSRGPLIRDGVLWLLLGFCAVVKLFPLLLAPVPWLVRSGKSKPKLWTERISFLVGGGIALGIPAVTIGFPGLFQLLLDWKAALIARGFPLESHNQSVPALIEHWFSGRSTAVMALGGQSINTTFWMVPEQMRWAAARAWSLLSVGLLFSLYIQSSIRDSMRWIALVLGLVVLPSHLVWKPYFVFGLPLAFELVRHSVLRFGAAFAVWVIFLFVAINLSGFDWVGHKWGAIFEASGILLWGHLATWATVAFLTPCAFQGLANSSPRGLSR